MGLVRHLWQTPWGLNCVFVEGSSVFEGGDGLKLSGPKIAPISQVGSVPGSIWLSLDMPDNLRPGRIGIHIVLHYNCAGKVIYDRTETLFFVLHKEKPLD